MADIVYKKFSELTQVSTLAVNDLFPIAQYISASDYNSKSVTFNTLYNQVSGALISPFTTAIQSSVTSSLTISKWDSTYTTVQTNSATWGASVVGTLTAFSQGNTSTIVGDPMTVRFLSAGTTANASVAFIATGTGATLAQLPDSGPTGGNARGQYATDWQKARAGASQVASGNYSTVGGGQNNTASGTSSTVAGGDANTASNTRATVGGGLNNLASGVNATVGGGLSNTASGINTTVGGGSTITASGNSATVGGGIDIIASGDYSIVGGGLSNTANGNYSSVLGGQSNNTNSKSNAHIIGSNMTAPSANFTYVNNISSQGDVRGANFYGPNIIKAWVTFDGSGTVGIACNILGSYNVSGVSKDASGEFTIQFTTPLANSYYAVAGSASSSSEATVMVDSAAAGGSPTLKTTQFLKIIVRSNTTTASNSEQIMVMVVGL